MTATVLPVTIQYNDEFDKAHYPLTEWHRDTVARIADHFKLGQDVVWTYLATLHGAVFSFEMPFRGIPGAPRLHADSIKFLADLPGFRWIDHRDGRTNIGLTHRKPERR